MLFPCSKLSQNATQVFDLFFSFKCRSGHLFVKIFHNVNNFMLGY